MADRREFIKLDVGYLSNPKVAGLLIAGRPNAVLIHVYCMTYSRQHRTDGIVPVALALRGVIGATKKDVAAAVDAGLLLNREEGVVEVHDYLEHQESAADIKARSDAGRAGAQARWGKAKRNADRTATSNANRNAEERRGEKRKNSSSEVADATLRPEITHLLDFLDKHIEANGSRKPQRTKRNIDAARLLLDKDGRTVEQIEAAITWCQTNEFWRANVLSMAKLREKYDQLRLAAQRQSRPTSSGDRAGDILRATEQRYAAATPPPFPQIGA